MKRQFLVTFDLPEDYTDAHARKFIKTAFPSCLSVQCVESVKEEHTQIVYAAGYQRGTHSYGMLAGPNPDLRQMLDFVPDLEDGEDADVYIFKITEHSDDVQHERIYRWGKKSSKWIKCKD